MKTFWGLRLGNKAAKDLFFCLPTALVVGAFTTASVGCSQMKFEDVSTAASGPSGLVSSSPSQLGNVDVQTTLNAPISFNTQLTFDNGRGVRLATDQNGSMSINTKYGTLQIVDGATLSVRYTPGTNFRGDDSVTVYLLQDGKVVSTATIRIRVNNPLVDLKPALVVRATGCVMCHATVNSNVITDFGYGDPWFWGGQALGSVNHTSIYADESTDPAWKFLNNLGPQVIVPRAATSHLSKVAAPTLAAYLQKTLGSSPQANVRNSQVVEMKSVFIGAPTAERIRKVGSLKHGTLVQYFPDANQPNDLPAIRHVQSPGSEYWTNDSTSPLICSGDLVIDGVLLLHKPVISTKTGCRIYVTKSVFSHGPVTYLGGDPANQNLQIVSARSINLGLGKNNCDAAGIGANSLLGRLQSDDRRHHYHTRGEPQKTVQQKLDDIVNDANQIATANMTDAACEPQHGRAVNFERMILNAPIVFSRYQGDFKGSIIAEIALMSLGAFFFEFDPVFSSQVVLPLLEPKDYLAVD